MTNEQQQVYDAIRAQIEAGVRLSAVSVNDPRAREAVIAATEHYVQEALKQVGINAPITVETQYDETRNNLDVTVTQHIPVMRASGVLVIDDLKEGAKDDA